MVSSTYLEPAVNRFLLLTNILTTVRIDKLQVPEVIASDCLDAVLDCAYSGASEEVTVVWHFNGIQVYEWRQGTDPKVGGVLEGRLDLTYKLTGAGGNIVEKRALRIVNLTPELSGDYTCIVRSRGQEVTETKTMTVFSPERDFELTLSTVREPGFVDIKCVAKRMHPRPEFILEYNKIPIGQQQQRVWREGQYYDGECVASLPRQGLRSAAGAELACRLQLPPVSYTAITKKYLQLENIVSGALAIDLAASCIVAAVVVSLLRV